MELVVNMDANLISLEAIEGSVTLKNGVDKTITEHITVEKNRLEGSVVGAASALASTAKELIKSGAIANSTLAVGSLIVAGIGGAIKGYDYEVVTETTKTYTDEKSVKAKYNANKMIVKAG